MNYEVFKIDEHTWRFDNGGVRFFLLEGIEQALMIDSGMTVPGAKEAAERLTDRPVRLFNTHADRDHISGNEAFGEILINPAELVNYPSRTKGVVPVGDGETMDLGDRKLLFVAVPGHTPGSTAVVDLTNRYLFSGDTIRDKGEIYLFGTMRNRLAFYFSLLKMQKHADEFDIILPCHGACPVSKDVLDEMVRAYPDFLAGKFVHGESERHGRKIWTYDIGPCILLCDPE